MNNITKDIFLNATVCPSLGWLLRSGAEIPGLTTQELTAAEEFRIEQGLEIGYRARKLYPDGILIPGGDIAGSNETTRQKLQDPAVSVLFEATFQVDDYVTRADILIRDGDGWQLLEVKSSVNDKAELLDDLAYTLMVISRTGLPITKASLLLISRDYRLGMDNASLFSEIDHTDDARVRSQEFDGLWDEVAAITSRARATAEAVLACKDCPILDECVADGIPHPIYHLPRLSQKKFDSLNAMGVMAIEDIPADFELTAHQSTVRNCVADNRIWKSPNLVAEMDAIEWPVYYLDFETVTTAIPLYPDIAPFTQIPTQYSIHKLDGFGFPAEHREYLADPSKDCREELALRLITDLEETGSILTYSPFEKTTVNGLIKLFPGLEEPLAKLIDRMVDLEPIIRKGFYHPEFHGRSSIKVVLPVVVPELSYKGMAIGDGDSAIAAFANMALGKITGDEAEQVRADLLTYCCQDTLAMVKLHETLYRW